MQSLSTIIDYFCFMSNVDNFSLIHKVNINDYDYYLHDYMIKKFDYFKPILEKRFVGELKVKYEYCDANLMDKFLNVIHNSREIILSINELNDMYNLLDFLICNDDTLYNKFVINSSNLSIDNIVTLSQHITSCNPKLIQKCFDEFLRFTNKISIKSMVLLLKNISNHNSKFISKYFNEFITTFDHGIQIFYYDRAMNGYIIENVIELLNKFDIHITKDMCTLQKNYDLNSGYCVKFTLLFGNLIFYHSFSDRYAHSEWHSDSLIFSRKLLRCIVGPYYFNDLKV